MEQPRQCQQPREGGEGRGIAVLYRTVPINTCPVPALQKARAETSGDLGDANRAKEEGGIWRLKDVQLLAAIGPSEKSSPASRFDLNYPHTPLCGEP